VTLTAQEVTRFIWRPDAHHWSRSRCLNGVDLERAVDTIAARAGQRRRALLVAISGIDGSGKSTLAAKAAELLEGRGLRTACITLDPWHTPWPMRHNADDPGAHFYRHAFRFDELFARLITPLQRHRSIRLTLDLIRLVDDAWVEHTYDFRDVDVILLEGIFLLRRGLRRRYDLAFWVECSFETALARALGRNQEGQSEARLRDDYRRIYFAAQRIHIARDMPAAHADGVIVNDGSDMADAPGGSLARKSGDEAHARASA
jgi:uridine kinase